MLGETEQAQRGNRTTPSDLPDVALTVNACRSQYALLMRFSFTSQSPRTRSAGRHEHCSTSTQVDKQIQGPSCEGVSSRPLWRNCQRPGGAVGVACALTGADGIVESASRLNTLVQSAWADPTLLLVFCEKGGLGARSMEDRGADIGYRKLDYAMTLITC